eukprot:TRINITY_DN26322_c0_g1_i1.p1 TRINITY_DN26322_c0_g1~~TRINITY_DN26322_c0_g1_i1.p1  ORF type:complete len:138 (-),score=21.83 TRINITY_DN26322_c0_g1_i1:29-442(-)
MGNAHQHQTTSSVGEGENHHGIHNALHRLGSHTHLHLRHQSLMAKVLDNPEDTQKIKQLFDNYDGRANGKLDESSFEQFVSDLTAEMRKQYGDDNEVVEPSVHKMFNDFDTDKDGYVTFEEFRSFFTRQMTESQNVQ